MKRRIGRQGGAVGKRPLDHAFAEIDPNNLVDEGRDLLSGKTRATADVYGAPSFREHALNSLDFEPTLPNIRMGDLRGVQSRISRSPIPKPLDARHCGFTPAAAAPDRYAPLCPTTTFAGQKEGNFRGGPLLNRYGLGASTL
jgi:hypothetical protein